MEKLRSWAVYEDPLRAAIIRLKYKRDMALGEALAELLMRKYIQEGWQADVIVPVPLGAARMAERGYNQAALLARPLALRLALPYSTQVKRVRETRSQVGLSAQERRDNVRGAFWADPHRFQRQQVLLVDDVTTTGSTLDACAQALLEVGADSVFGLTLARSG